jgi:hypothetical protein
MVDAHPLDGRALPDRCHVVLPGMPAGSNIALCVRGECGVRITSIECGSATSACPLVRAFNASLGIDERQERAMLMGCLFGWDAEQRRWRVKSSAGPSSTFLH